MKTFDDFLVIAHRGYSGKYPENTMIAVQQAIAVGADAIEMDLQLSSDGEIVVIHDEFLDRLAGCEGFVYNSTLSELQSLDVGSWKEDTFKGASIPTFREVCSEIGPQCLFMPGQFNVLDI